MSSFNSLTYIPPQNVSGKMEYDIQLNNVLSNQQPGEKDVKITFPKLSFSTKNEPNSLVFSKWKNPNLNDGKLSLGLGIYANRFRNFTQEMYYFDVATIPNAKKTEEGAYFTIKDSIYAFNDALQQLFSDLGAQSNTSFSGQASIYEIFARIPTYTARFEGNHFIIESDYPYPIFDKDDPIIVDGEGTDFDTFSIYSAKVKWETTTVLPPLCLPVDESKQDAIQCVARGYQNTKEIAPEIDTSKLQVYSVIAPNGVYTYGDITVTRDRMFYVLMATPELCELYSFLPWKEDADYPFKILDKDRCFCRVSDDPPLIISNGRGPNHYYDYYKVAFGFYYLELKKHYFSFPLTPEKAVPVKVTKTSEDITITTTHLVYIPTNNMEEDLFQDTRFIHITYESGFFVPSYFVRGTYGGNQQLINTNVIYTFDRYKDASMFKTGEFYFDEQAIQNMPYILTKLGNLSSYNVIIRVYKESFNGEVSIMNGSNFFIQLRFEYD